MKENKHHILPFFIPHLGCPHQCIFCNQHHVSGEHRIPTAEEIIKAIDLWEGATLPEIAFYGGSFTGLSEKEQRYFLDPVARALREEKIYGIRVSTRPDYINENALALLEEYGVKTVELGVQSMDDQVLQAARRGHSADDVSRAVKLLKKRGFTVGVQLMPGLPGDDREKSIKGLLKIAWLQPDQARIYPTLVLKDTPLHKLFLEGRYVPLNLEQAIGISRDMLAILRYFDVNVIRVGLQPTEDISLNAQVAAGPFHPAFGELVEGALFREQISFALAQLNLSYQPSSLSLYVADQDCSIAAGHKRANLIYLKEKYALDRIKILGMKEMPRRTVGISEMAGEDPQLIITEQDFLQYYVAENMRAK